MHIVLTRHYEIKSDLTSAQFIKAVDEMMEAYDSRLDSLDMGDAVHAAVDLAINGSLNPDTIDISWENTEYNYIDCPDSRTQLTKDEETGVYEIVPGTNSPDFKSPYELARETILQGRDVIQCTECKANEPYRCFDEGGYSGWVCPTWLHETMQMHFAGVDIEITDISGDGTAKITLKGWTP